MFKVLLWAFIAETAVGALVKREHSVVSDSLRGMDCSLTGSSVHGFLQTRILEWVAMPSSRDLPNSEIEPVSLMSLAWMSAFFTTCAT